MAKVVSAWLGLLAALEAFTVPALAQDTTVAVFAAPSDAPPAALDALESDLAARIGHTPGYRGIVVRSGPAAPGAAAERLGASEYAVVQAQDYEDGAEIALIALYSSRDGQQIGSSVRVRVADWALPRDFDAASVLPAAAGPVVAVQAAPPTVAPKTRPASVPTPPPPRPTPVATAPPTPRPTAVPTAPPTPRPPAVATAPPTPRPIAAPAVSPAPRPTPLPIAAPAPRTTAAQTVPLAPRTTPVPAAQPTAQVALAPRPVPAATAFEPCALNAQFLRFHRFIIEAAGKASDAGFSATGRGSVPARRRDHAVEDDYSAVEAIVGPALDAISKVPHALDGAPEGASKDTAFQLSAFYVSALHEIRDYTRAAVVYERTLSGATAVDPAQAGLGFDTARKILETQATAVSDTKSAIAVPEYQYAAACSIGVPASSLKATRSQGA